MKNSRGLAIVIIVACIAILAAILALPKILKGPKQDATTGCTADISARTVILLDHSEDVTKQTKDEILARVKNTVEKKVQVGELVSVFYITELSKRNLVPEFSYCKPKSLANPLTESEKLVSKTFREKFMAPLEAKINHGIPGSKESPIAQSLVNLSLLDQMRSDKPVRLMVFSDLMEHTEKFSMYKCSASRIAVAAYKTSRGSSVARPAFKNLDVELHVVPRSGVSKNTGECRDGFWTWFFGDNDGPSAHINRHDLPGGA